MVLLVHHRKFPGWNPNVFLSRNDQSSSNLPFPEGHPAAFGLESLFGRRNGCWGYNIASEAFQNSHLQSFIFHHSWFTGTEDSITPRGNDEQHLQPSELKKGLAICNLGLYMTLERWPELPIMNAFAPNSEVCDKRENLCYVNNCLYLITSISLSKKVWWACKDGSILLEQVASLPALTSHTLSPELF